MIQSTVPSRTRPIRRTLLALLALAALWGALVVLALSSVPAGADTTFTVNKTGDAGDRRLADSVCDISRKRGKQCTLRAAIEESNDTLGTDTINFNIGGTNSVKTISPASPLPEITQPVTINGYTQRGSRTNTLAVGNDAVIKIQLNGTNAGTDAIPNPNGLEISASNSTIKGLVINRFSDPDNPDGNAVLIVEGATNNKVEGNFIGTNASGTQALGNGFAGVFILGDDNTVGGTSPAARNVISGNKSHGVLINGVLAGGTGNKVEGNFIGTTADGSGDLGNGERGVAILQGANGNTIGGTVGGASNVISGNDVSGVQIAGSAGNEVERNFIGTTADGSGDLGNGGQGVFIAAASNNTIGDSDPSDGLTNAANTIAFNDADGVVVSSSGTGNRILSNRIFQNGQVGIDLQGTNDVTANDDDDPDFGPNNLQNFPVITSATRSGSTTTITGTLNSNPSQTYTIQCFLADGISSDHGEGQIFLAQDTTASTNASGDGSFTCSTTLGAGVGQVVTATATNTTGTAIGTAIGDTSEFSLNFQVTAGP